MTDSAKRCLLCGDPQQPSEAMYESAGHLQDRGVTVERMDWRADLSGADFRDVTMDMEERGPSDYDASAIVENVAGVEFLVVHKAPVSRAVIEAGEDLEVVAAARGGVENLDVEAAAEHGVTVLHAPGRNADAVADYAVAFGLAAHRRIPHFVETTGRGEWALEFDPAGLPRDVRSLTVGVIGLGNVGRNVVERWSGFGPEVLGHDPYVDDGDIKDLGATPAGFEETLANADLVTLHVRLSEETHHLIDADALEAMDDDALLVNTARGGLVDTDALVDALEAGDVGGAALDVFEEEPLPEDHPLLSLENAWLSPHTAGSTRDAVLNGSRIVADDLAAILSGEGPEHRVD
ncbi:NAD(P)-dependent oxidoreductase [Halomicrobium urmianum]|uniref:NAD(P)-dependent oxidoreductase n=1 Tax=Halomicrobium urmianum TaxID=1586233 RepID=UPI001CDA09A9|nr:NAD(P)-dependent oxidoreductase [Halomicrobium urmianum]